MQEAGATTQTKRSSVRTKRKRSTVARKFISYTGAEGLRLALDSRLEQLEATNFSDLIENERDDDTEDYFEDDAKDSGNGRNKRQKRGAALAAKKKLDKKNYGGGKGSRKLMVKLKSLSDVLLREEARRTSLSCGCIGAPSYLTATCSVPLNPGRSICVASGFGARYRDPVSNLSFANSKALAMIQEAAPPWTKGSVHATYAEAISSLRQSRSNIFDPMTKRKKLK